MFKNHSDEVLQFYDSICHLPQSFVCFCLLVSGRRTPFKISCKADLVLMNSLSFCQGKYLFLFHIWMITLLDRVFWANSFYLSGFWECHSTLSWPIEFLVKNLLIAYWGFLCRLPSLFPWLSLKLFVIDFWQFYCNMSWRWLVFLHWDNLLFP